MCREQIHEGRKVCTLAHTLLAVVGIRDLLEVAPNGTAKALLPLTPNKLQGTPPALPLYLEVAIKSSVDIFYFNVPYDLSAVLMDSGPVPKDDFQRVWQNQSVQKAMSQGVFAQRVMPEMVAARLQQYFCYVVVKTQGQEADSLYISCTTSNKLTVFCELSLQKGGPGVRAQCCSEQPVMVPLFQSFLSELLQVKWQQGGPPVAGGSSVLFQSGQGFWRFQRCNSPKHPGFAEYQLVMFWRTTVARVRPGRADECRLEEKKLGLWGIATSAVAITTFYSIYESSHGLTISSLVSAHSGQHIAAVHL
ncbi:Ap1b1 [Symbiodinium necroappetens]|uniref:Ap1b1 protein n=1 Tax=Symbiodinium necroappetens TaxID=1628268 RepID=A0A813C8A9_9DINO|nr:Ap1b1 [Symbiodinium necroappetens]